MNETRDVAGTPVRFFTNPAGRWIFAGCRNPEGYATQRDAELEARLQITNQYVGSLNTSEVPPATHRLAVRTLGLTRQTRP